MLTSIKYSFYDISMIGEAEKFVGIKNYKLLFSHSSFLKALKNTLILLTISLGTTIPIGFLLANLINSLGRGKLQGFFRVGFYLPHIITGATVTMILQVVLKANDGLFNNFLSAILGREISIGWLSDSNYSKWGATLISFWSGLGYTILINLANLQSIPTELYEAANIDGAGPFQKLIHITVPNMKSCFVFLLVTGVIGGMARFTDLYIIGGNTTSGAPNGSLQTIMMYIYQFSFEKMEFGMASAGAMVLFLITLVFAVISARMSGFFKDPA